MKNLLLILTEFPPAIGGMQTHAILLSRHFASQGFKVSVYTYRAVDQVVETKLSDQQFPFVIHRSLTRIGYHKNLKILEEAVKKHQPDLIYSSTVYYGILERMTKVPVICRCVGNDILRPWIAYPFRFGKNMVSLYFIEKRLYKFFKKIHKPEFLEILFRNRRMELTVDAAKSASKILANSTFTEELLIEAGVPREKISKVVGGVDYDFFKRNYSGLRDRLKEHAGQKTILLTACRLVDKKGVDFLIQSMTHLENHHLVVVGNGRRMNRLRKLAHKLGVADEVTFIGAIPYGEMPKYFWAADIFVLASTVYQDRTTGLRDAETMGRVLCEANAAGLPIIATRSGGIPSVVKHNHNGLLFPENDMERFLFNIHRLHNEQGLKDRLVQNGLIAAQERFDWKHVLNAHELCFNQL